MARRATTAVLGAAVQLAHTLRVFMFMLTLPFLALAGILVALGALAAQGVT